MFCIAKHNAFLMIPQRRCDFGGIHYLIIRLMPEGWQHMIKTRRANLRGILSDKGVMALLPRKFSTMRGCPPAQVICADSSFLDRRTSKSAVERCLPGAEVHCFGDVKEAFSYITDKGCDVLLTDIEFDRRDCKGIELAQKVRSMNSKADIIFVTEVPEWHYISEILPMRVSGYVRKPYQKEQLSRELSNLRYHSGVENQTPDLTNGKETRLKVIGVECDNIQLRHMKEVVPQVLPMADFFATTFVDEAAQFAEDNGCDVLISEIDIYGYYDGIKLAQRIREINPYAKIIFATVVHEFEYARELIDLRIDSFVRKPYEVEGLSKEIDRVFATLE